MAQATTTSGQFSLKARDFLKGLVMAVGTPVLYLLQELIPGWDLPPLAKAAIAATITYLLKNFFAPAQVVVTDPTPKLIEDAKAGNVKVTSTN